MKNQTWLRQYGPVLLTGIVVGVAALILTAAGNPKNMGFCIACFERDIAGALGFHSAAKVQYLRPEIAGIVRRVVNGMTEDELAAMKTAVPTYARRIAEKIAALEQLYRAEQFRKGLDSGKIVCRPSYALPSVITPAQTIDSVPLSLYEAERGDMNAGERGLLDVIAGMDNALWWHRIIERKGFYINGGINHYPDFMVMTKRGCLVLVEFKGDDRDNSDSKAKLALGRQWQACARQEKYRYFMVFQNRDLGIDGAYTVEEFLEILREL